MRTNDETLNGWRCYFEDTDGVVLRSVESFADPEAAAMWAHSIADNPEAHPDSLEDPDGEIVDPERIDPACEPTVELEG